MSKVKQVLRMHAQGISNRRIAGELGLYKGTVNNYVNKVKDHGYDIEELLALDDPVLESKLFAGKTREHNQTRMQWKEYCRQEKSLEEEKPLLKELPREAFEVKYYMRRRVEPGRAAIT